MPKLSAEIKQQIKSLSKDQLEEIVMKAASSNTSVLDFITIRYLDKDAGEQELFEKTKEEINQLFFKSYRGYSDQLKLANKLKACIKKLNEKSKFFKNKLYEAKLLMFILDEVFGYPVDFFGTCFTVFDSKTGIILKRLLTLLKKIHPDYHTEFEDKINRYLEILHRRSNHIDNIYNLPKTI